MENSSNVYLLIHKCILHTYYLPGKILDSGDSALKKTKQNQESHGMYISVATSGFIS